MIGKYWKAIIATLGVVATGLGTVAADPDVVAAVPSGWGVAVLAAGTAVTGLVTLLKRNQKTIDSVDAAIDAGDFSLRDLEAYIATKRGAV